MINCVGVEHGHGETRHSVRDTRYSVWEGGERKSMKLTYLCFPLSNGTISFFFSSSSLFSHRFGMSSMLWLLDDMPFGSVEREKK